MRGKKREVVYMSILIFLEAFHNPKFWPPPVICRTRNIPLPSSTLLPRTPSTLFGRGKRPPAINFTGLGERLLFVNWRFGLNPAALAPVSCTDKALALIAVNWRAMVVVPVDWGINPELGGKRLNMLPVCEGVMGRVGEGSCCRPGVCGESGRSICRKKILS